MGNADVSVSPKIRPLLRIFFQEVIISFDCLLYLKRTFLIRESDVVDIHVHDVMQWPVEPYITCCAPTLHTGALLLCSWNTSEPRK